MRVAVSQTATGAQATQEDFRVVYLEVEGKFAEQCVRARRVQNQHLDVPTAFSKALLRGPAQAVGRPVLLGFLWIGLRHTASSARVIKAVTRKERGSNCVSAE